MMKLGFVTAILGDLDLDGVLSFASAEKFDLVEAVCWPVGKAERRYAGVTHIDVGSFGSAEANTVKNAFEKYGVGLSALGYYPNPLVADEREADVYITHLKKVISAAPLLGVNTVNTFIGREPRLTLAENWSMFDKRWPDIIRHAETNNVRIAIENCPMYFSNDEWPAGKNLAVSPKIWREMFSRIPSPNFGLNYDPSHFVWQGMDPISPIREFAPKFFHVHAKDVWVDKAALNECGILATPLEYHRPKLPGLGDVDWRAFFTALTEARYTGPVCIEAEDRAYEGSLEDRKSALRQSARFLRNYM